MAAAGSFFRYASRVPGSSLRRLSPGSSSSLGRFAFPSTAVPPAKTTTNSRRFVSLLRAPVELASMLPLHSAVASARINSHLSTKSISCRALSQGDIDGLRKRIAGC